MVSSQIVDLARARSTFIQAGGLTLPIADGRYSIPTLTAGPSGVWRGENLEVTGSDMTFGRVVISPKTLGILVPCSIELLEDAANLQGFINSVFAETLAKEIDRVCYVGSGVGAEPKGVWTYTTGGINTVAGGGALTSYDKIIDATQAIYEDNYQGDYSGLSVVMPPRTYAALNKFKTGISNDQTPLFEPAAVQKMKKFQTTQAPITLGTGTNESMVLVGDYSQAALCVRTGLTLEASRTAGDSFKLMQVMLRGYIRADVALIRSPFFCKVTGVTN